MTVLDARALNRATLARQLLLDRVDLPRVAVGHERRELASLLSGGECYRARVTASPG